MLIEIILFLIWAVGFFTGLVGIGVGLEEVLWSYNIRFTI